MRCSPAMSSGVSPAASVSALAASFICGTDSPVSVASLATAAPLRMSASQGTRQSSSAVALVSEMMSPGSSSSLLTCIHAPLRSANTPRLLWPMPRSVCRLRRRPNAVVPSNMKIMPTWNSAYFQYSSITHSSALKSWNCVTGPSSCSTYSWRSEGTGTLNSLRPKRLRSVPGSTSVSSARSPLAARYSRSGSATGYGSCIAAHVSTAPATASSSYRCRWNMKKRPSSRSARVKASTATSSGLPWCSGGVTSSTVPLSSAPAGA